MVPETNIPAVLQQSRLQIKTTANPGSWKQVWMYFYSDIDYELAGGLIIAFRDPIAYWVTYCEDVFTPLPTTPPTDVTKVWSIYRTGKALRVQCNGKLVLDYDISHCTNQNFWSREIKQIKFSGSDTASEQYRIISQGKLEKITQIVKTLMNF